MVDLTQQCLVANGFVCARIDGQLSLEGRSKAINQFNLDSKCTIMLATIGSAAEGQVISQNHRPIALPYYDNFILTSKFIEST